MTARASLLLCVALIAFTGCESREQKLARLKQEADVACKQASDAKHRFVDSFGKWMGQYPDTLLQVAAAYGDTIEALQNKCNAANAEYENVRHE